MLHAIGRLGMVFDGFDTVPVDDSIALRAAELESEGFHRDPPDRIIAATAIVNGYRFATSDRLVTA